MDIATAKTIPLDEFLLAAGHQPAKISGGCKFYRAPYRTENHPSFKLSPDATAWYDHGLGQGGNIIDLAMHLGPCQNVSDALAYIQALIGRTTVSRYRSPASLLPLPVSPQTPIYSLTQAKPFALRDQYNHYTPAASYLKLVRAIEPDVFAPYLLDLVYCAQDQFPRYGFGIPNLAGGFEVRRAGDFFKTTIGPKHVTVFQSQRQPWWQAPWHCFYGLMDLGTFLTLDCPPLGTYNFLVVNSDSLIGHPQPGPDKLAKWGLAEQYLESIPPGQSMVHYPHQDASGQRAYSQLRAFLQEQGWSGCDRAKIYQGFKDWNEKHQADSGIQPQR